jgi:hypothetical protein
MLVIMFVAGSFLALLAASLWCAYTDRNEDRTEEGPVAGSGREPESLEGVLVERLLGKRISHEAYLREMAELALRDDDRRPLKLPPDL